MKTKSSIPQPVGEAGSIRSGERSQNRSTGTRIRWRIVYLSVVAYTILLILVLHLLSVSSAEAPP